MPPFLIVGHHSHTPHRAAQTEERRFGVSGLNRNRRMSAREVSAQPDTVIPMLQKSQIHSVISDHIITLSRLRKKSIAVEARNTDLGFKGSELLQSPKTAVRNSLLYQEGSAFSYGISRKDCNSFLSHISVGNSNMRFHFSRSFMGLP
jgi:hypothetical protein